MSNSPNKIFNANLPKHLAIIPDGNRRWAKKRGLNPWKGHYEGVKAFERVIRAADKLNLYCFSFWAASIDNILKRQKQEVVVLLEIFKKNFEQLLKNKKIHEEEVRVNIFGRWPEHFPARVKKPMEEIIAATKGYDRRFLNFFIMYDGIDEMTEAIKRIAADCKKDLAVKITSELIKSYLYTKDLLPVDLVIRTGVENDPHNSAGFMMWDTAYSQLYFTKTLWPDFEEKEFRKAVKDYAGRERRRGA